MMCVLPGYVAVALFPRAPMIYNPFPVGTTLYLLWSETRGKQRDDNWGLSGSYSFVPATVGHLARWSISDGDRGGVRRVEWRPFMHGAAQGGREGIPSHSHPAETLSRDLPPTATETP